MRVHIWKMNLKDELIPFASVDIVTQKYLEVLNHFMPIQVCIGQCVELAAILRVTIPRNQRGAYVELIALLSRNLRKAHLVGLPVFAFLVGEFFITLYVVTSSDSTHRVVTY